MLKTKTLLNLRYFKLYMVVIAGIFALFIFLFCYYQQLMNRSMKRPFEYTVQLNDREEVDCSRFKSKNTAIFLAFGQSNAANFGQTKIPLNEGNL
jgi:hypothetical protein